MDERSSRRKGGSYHHDLLYNPRGLVDSLTDIQHDFGGIIHSSLHAHMDHDNCLEVLVLKGEGKDVKKAAERMMALKGVKHVKLNTTTVVEEF